MMPTNKFLQRKMKSSKIKVKNKRNNKMMYKVSKVCIALKTNPKTKVNGEKRRQLRKNSKMALKVKAQS